MVLRQNLGGVDMDINTGNTARPVAQPKPVEKPVNNKVQTKPAQPAAKEANSLLNTLGIGQYFNTLA